MTAFRTDNTWRFWPKLPAPSHKSTQLSSGNPYLTTWKPIRKQTKLILRNCLAIWLFNKPSLHIAINSSSANSKPFGNLWNSKILNSHKNFLLNIFLNYFFLKPLLHTSADVSRLFFTGFHKYPAILAILAKLTTPTTHQFGKFSTFHMGVGRISCPPLVHQREAVFRPKNTHRLNCICDTPSSSECAVCATV